MPAQDSQKQATTGAAGPKDAYGYPVFDMPWTFNLSYNLNYAPTYLNQRLIRLFHSEEVLHLLKRCQPLSRAVTTSMPKKITMTNIGITRDLHCWDMSFNWVPNGTLQSWNFMIKVKAAVLGDLKYERRKDFHDSY